MLIWNVYDDEIRELVEEVGLRINGDYGGGGIRRVGRAYQFRLRLGERDEDGVRRFQRLGYRGRKIHGVCWHGHREFFFALYRRFPDARVRTGVTRYRNRQHFLSTYRETMGLTCSGFVGVHRERGCVCQGQAQPDPLSALPVQWWDNSASWTVSTDFGGSTNRIIIRTSDGGSDPL